MSGHESHDGGNLTAIELAEERIVPFPNLFLDATGMPISFIFGALFMNLHIESYIGQSGKMDGGGHGGHGH